MLSLGTADNSPYYISVMTIIQNRGIHSTLDYDILGWSFQGKSANHLAFEAEKAAIRGIFATFWCRSDLSAVLRDSAEDAESVS